MLSLPEFFICKVGSVLNTALRVLFHLSPVVPLALGLNYAAIAMTLLVLLFYVKVMKLKGVMRDLKERGFEGSREFNETARLLSRWARFTFL